MQEADWLEDRSKRNASQSTAIYPPTLSKVGFVKPTSSQWSNSPQCGCGYAIMSLRPSGTAVP